MVLCTLRPVREADMTLFEEAVNDPNGLGEYQWFGYKSFQELRLEHSSTGMLTTDGGWLTVAAAGQEVAGRVQWSKACWGPATTSWCWTIGIMLLNPFRGRGLGTEAQAQLVEYLFAHTHACRIQAATDERNYAERRSLEKVGFTYEGALRGAQWRSGRWHDQVLYSILRSDARNPIKAAQASGGLSDL